MENAFSGPSKTVTGILSLFTGNYDQGLADYFHQFKIKDQVFTS
jgi:hypothetical protein